MEHTFLISVGAAALAECGDKTQLLSLILAARYRKPLSIILGILAATLMSHAVAGALGTWFGALLTPSLMRLTLVLSFLGMGIWTLLPDRFCDSDININRSHLGVFSTTVVAFFLAEMGDKTQLATAALAVRFHDFFTVVTGTTLGMMLANIPVILLGKRFTHRLPTRTIRTIAAALFILLGVLAFFNVGV